MKLDDRSGPALPLTADAQERMIAAALEEVYPLKRRPRWIALAAAVFLLIGAPAAVAAWMYARPPEKTIAPPPPPLPKPVVKAEPEVVEEEPAPPAPEPRTKKKKEQRSEDLLAKANALRRESKWREAEAVYLEVADRFPKSGSAYVALVAAASLRLEHLDDPKGALALLAKAAKRKGPLDAEILWSRSRAYRALGRAAEERRAIETLLAEHPDAPFVDAARERAKQIP